MPFSFSLTTVVGVAPLHARLPELGRPGGGPELSSAQSSEALRSPLGFLFWRGGPSLSLHCEFHLQPIASLFCVTSFCAAIARGFRLSEKKGGDYYSYEFASFPVVRRCGRAAPCTGRVIFGSHVPGCTTEIAPSVIFSYPASGPSKA